MTTPNQKAPTVNLHRLALASALTLGGGLVAAPVVATIAPIVASAHTPDYHAECGGFHYSLTNYPAGSHVTITIDGKVVVDSDFTGTSAATFPWNSEVSHTWSIVATDTDHIGEVNDHGTQEACVLPPPTDTTVPPTTTVPTTTTVTLLPPTTIFPPTTVPTTSAPPTTVPGTFTVPTVPSPPTVPTTTPSAPTSATPTTSPVPPTTVVTHLPVTGRNDATTVAIGVLAFLVGTITVLVTRRRA